MRASPKFLVDTLGPFFARKKGNNTLGGHLYIGIGSTYDVGSSSTTWRAGYFDTVFSGGVNMTIVAARTVDAGVGLVSDGTQLKDGNPLISMGTPDTLSKTTANNATNDPDTHTHAITETEDADGTPDTILSSDSVGRLIVRYLRAVTHVRTPLIVSLDSGPSDQDLTLYPTDLLVFYPQGEYAVPGETVVTSIGQVDNKFKQSAFAYAYHGMATGRDMQSVIPGAFRMSAVTTYLSRDCDDNDTTIYTPDDLLADGDYIVLYAWDDSATPISVQEVMAITTDGNLEGAGDYSYTVTRIAGGGEGGGAQANIGNNDFNAFYYGFMPSSAESPYIASAQGGESGTAGTYFAGDGIMVLGRTAGEGWIEWSQDMVDEHEGPGIGVYERVDTDAAANYDPVIYIGQANGYADYEAAAMAFGAGNDLGLDPDDVSGGFIGIWVDKTQTRIVNPDIKQYEDDRIKGRWDAGGDFKLGFDTSLSAATWMHFSGDQILFGLANSDHIEVSTSGVDIVGDLTQSYLEELDIVGVTDPTSDPSAGDPFGGSPSDGTVRLWYDIDDDKLKIRDYLGEDYIVAPTGTRDLIDVYDIAPDEGDILRWDDGDGRYEPYPIGAATVEIPQAYDVYIDVKERQAEEHIHGNFDPQIVTGDSLATGDDIVFTTGIGKLIFVINAGSDFDGEFTVTGTSVDRDTGVETGSDTDIITVDALTTTASTTDSNGNTVHDHTEAYITSKWFKGSVTLSTTTIDISDMDVWQISFDQFGDYSDVTLRGLDVTAEATNGSAWLDIYMYSVIPTTGNKVTVETVADLHVSAADSTADRYYRLRRGNLGVAMDGATDGIFVDVNLGPLVLDYWEDINIKVWYSQTVDVSGELVSTLYTDFIDFNVDYADGAEEGRLQWNIDDGTLEVGMPGGQVTLQLGQEMLIRCRNETGDLIPNGSVVYVDDFSGNKPLIDLADSTDPLKLSVIGMTTEDIAHNDNGYVNSAGFVRGVDTDGMSIGLPVFLDEDTPGGYTQTRPTAPNYIWIMGIVIKVHASEGVIYNSPTPGHVMMSMSDVYTEVPEDGEYLAYVAANERFELKAAPEGVLDQYLLLAGRAGGQVAYGGTGSGDDLRLDSTSHATKGYVLIGVGGGDVGIGTATPSTNLHVYRATGTVGILAESPGASSIALNLKNSVVDWRIQNNTVGKLHFTDVTNSNTVMTFAPDDYAVGFNNLSPETLIDAFGVIRTTGYGHTPTTGAGLEFAFNTAASRGQIRSYDRDTTTNLDLRFFTANFEISSTGSKLSVGKGNPENVIDTYDEVGGFSAGAVESTTGTPIIVPGGATDAKYGGIISWVYHWVYSANNGIEHGVTEVEVPSSSANVYTLYTNYADLFLSVYSTGEMTLTDTHDSGEFAWNLSYI